MKRALLYLLTLSFMHHGAIAVAQDSPNNNSDTKTIMFEQPLELAQSVEPLISLEPLEHGTKPTSMPQQAAPEMSDEEGEILIQEAVLWRAFVAAKKTVVRTVATYPLEISIATVGVSASVAFAYFAKKLLNELQYQRVQLPAPTPRLNAAQTNTETRTEIDGSLLDRLDRDAIIELKKKISKLHYAQVLNELLQKNLEHEMAAGIHDFQNKLHEAGAREAALNESIAQLTRVKELLESDNKAILEAVQNLQNNLQQVTHSKSAADDSALLLQSEIGGLLSNNHNLETSNAGLKNHLRKLFAALSKKGEEVAELQSRVADLESTIENNAKIVVDREVGFEQRIALQESDNEALAQEQKRLHAANTSLESSNKARHEDLANLNAVLAEKNEEIAILEQNALSLETQPEQLPFVDGPSPDNQELETLKKEVASLAEANLQLKEQFSKSWAEAQPILDHYSVVATEFEVAKNEVAALNLELQNDAKKIGELTGNLFSLGQEKTALEKAKASAVAANTELNRQLVQQKEGLGNIAANARREKSEYESTLASLNDELAKNGEERAKLAKTLKELIAACTAKNQQIEQMESVLRDQDALDRKNLELATKIRSLEAQLQTEQKPPLNGVEHQDEQSFVVEEVTIVEEDSVDASQKSSRQSNSSGVPVDTSRPVSVISTGPFSRVSLIVPSGENVTQKFSTTIETTLNKHIAALNNAIDAANNSLSSNTNYSPENAKAIKSNVDLAIGALKSAIVSKISDLETKRSKSSGSDKQGWAESITMLKGFNGNLENNTASNAQQFKHFIQAWAADSKRKVGDADELKKITNLLHKLTFNL